MTSYKGRGSGKTPQLAASLTRRVLTLALSTFLTLLSMFLSGKWRRNSVASLRRLEKAVLVEEEVLGTACTPAVPSFGSRQSNTTSSRREVCDPEFKKSLLQLKSCVNVSNSGHNVFSGDYNKRKKFVNSKNFLSN